jgi:hypothetical protein
MPLLVWDLNTLSGAFFSALLHCRTATLEDLVSITHILFAARLVHALVSPNGYKAKDFSESGPLDQEQAGASPQILLKDIIHEANALVKLKDHCFRMIDRAELPESDTSATSSQPLLEAICDAVLPFT